MANSRQFRGLSLPPTVPTIFATFLMCVCMCAYIHACAHPHIIKVSKKGRDGKVTSLCPFVCRNLCGLTLLFRGGDR